MFYAGREVNMVITRASTNEIVVIDRIIGQDKTIRYLQSLGLIAGQSVTIINEMGGNVILEIKSSRIALDKDLARKIIIKTRREMNENAGQNQMRRKGHGGKNRRSRSRQAAHHGHGHH